MLLDISNRHLLAVSPEYGTNGDDWAIEYLRGAIDPSPAYLVSQEEGSDWIAIGNLQPNHNAKRFYLDVSVLPDYPEAKGVLEFFIGMARSEQPDYVIWPSCNANDARFRQLFTELAFEPMRYFNTLRADLIPADPIVLPDGLSVRNVDLHDAGDMKIWHDLHLDAFSKHFGFVPRSHESWLELMREDELLKEDSVYLLFKADQPVGFIFVSDEIAHLDSGYVNHIGVAHAHQGNGYGELLLSIGLEHSRKRGYSQVELQVDSENESGALRLYEKMGFKLLTTWIQYDDKRL